MIADGLIFLSLSIGLLVCLGCAAGAPPAGVPQRIIRQIVNESRADFVRVFYHSEAMGKDQSFALFIPETYDPAKSTPAVVFLHSHWSAFDDKQWLRVTEIPGTIQDECARRGWVAIGPEAGGNSWYHGKAEEQVLESVEQARKYLNIDTRRLYLVGRSMGGAGALTIAMHHPDRVAGVVSLAGVSDYPAICKTNSYMLGNDAGSVRTRFGGTPDEKPEVYRQMSAVNYAEVLKTIPVFLIHGATDGVVPVYHSRALAEKLQKAGGKVVFKEVPNEGHNMEMIEWFTADYFKFLEGNPPARK